MTFPSSHGATETPIGRYREFSITAARIAVAAEPPAPRTDAAANCAEPANVVMDITIGATLPIPAAGARTP